MTFIYFFLIKKMLVLYPPPALTIASCLGLANKLILTEGITVGRPMPQEHFRIFICLVVCSRPAIISDHCDSTNRRALTKSAQGLVFIC